MKSVRLLASVLLLLLAVSTAGAVQPITYVIHISIDGLRPDAVTALGPTGAPNFYRLRTEGAFTDNARTDYDYTVTWPNHATELTGRPVLGTNGHQLTISGPVYGAILPNYAGHYIAGVFDVAHDNGLHTFFYCGKDFSVFRNSWNGINGAPDITGPDNGRYKIENYIYTDSSDPQDLIHQLELVHYNYTFFHFRQTDSVGHASGWDVTPGSDYSNAVKLADDFLGAILNLIETDQVYRGKTAIVLTADHGGMDYQHSDKREPEDYTVPFYVWGPGVAAGADLYALNQGRRLDPGTGRPTYNAPIQPIRNGEVGNVGLKLLGLPAIPGSVIGAAQDLQVMGSQIQGCYLFYNNSYFDGNNPAASEVDDAAIAIDKTALRPSGTAAFANYSSYAKGINGVMVDLADMFDTPTLADFGFSVSDGNNPPAWSEAPAPTSLTVREGAGASDSARVTLIWADNAIKNRWLKITVRASVRTGLPADEVYYFGNLIGESGNSAAAAQVNDSDVTAARADTHKTAMNRAAVTNRYDFNRDSLVNTVDEVTARGNFTTIATELKLIVAP